MTSRKPSGPRGSQGGIPNEDQALWDLVASRLEPAKGKPRVLDVETTGDDRPPSRFNPVNPVRSRPARNKIGGERGGGAIDTVQAGPQRSPSGTGAAASRPPLPEPRAVVLERKRARRIARGAEAIEARLDLHGMTQDDAHATLTGFIRRCHAAGFRTVLVITGKGGAGREDRRDSDAHHRDPWQRPRGILKRNVPIWLSQPDLGALIVSFSTAHVRHGGEGAIYVQLRIKR